MQGHVSTESLSILLNALSKKGIKKDLILKHIGLKSDFLGNTNKPVSAIKIGALSHFLAVCLGDETLGLLERKTDPGTLEMSLYSCINCSTLNEAIPSLFEFWNIIHKDVHLQLVKAGRHAYTIVAYNDSYPNIVVNLFNLTLIRWLCWLTGQRIKPEVISYRYSTPGNISGYKHVYGCEAEFGANQYRMIFDRSILNKAITKKAENISSQIKVFPYELLIEEPDRYLSLKIRNIIQNSIRPEESSLTDIALSLHKNPETVRKALQKEGYTFSQIKQEIIRQTAIYGVLHRNESITDIAIKSGFSEPSSFNRAFKRWTGVTPKYYRDLHQSFN